MIAKDRELFGDTLAVLYMRDLKIMADITPEGSLRDFGISHPAEGWTHTKQHTLLTPVRGHLGEFLETTAFRDSQAVLRAVLDAIVGELTASFENPNFEIKPGPLNRSMIERLNNYKVDPPPKIK